MFNYAIENQKLGYKLDPYKLKDIIDKTIEGCDQEFKLKRQRLFNPFYWIYNLLAFTLRIPFMLIQLTGFDVSKVEDHFISKLFKLAFLVGICYVLSSWFGFTKDDLKELIPTFLK